MADLAELDPQVPAPFAAGDPELERMRARWQVGDWDGLAELDEAALGEHPDRARLCLLAAAGCFQTGDAERGRRLVRAALQAGCERALVARVLIGGVRNSLARAAALGGDEERAQRLFEAAVATVDRRGDRTALGRARTVHESARLGLLPEAARLIGADLAALQSAALPDRGAADRLGVQLELLQGVLSRVVARGQLAPGSGSGGGGSAPERRSASQLGQDVWVLERTGQKRGGVFVEFGATDGVLYSNSLMLERDYGWSGICAEPNPAFFEKLKRNRTCTVAPDLITATTGEEVEFLLADEYGGAVRHAGADNNADRRKPFLEAGSVIRLTGISLHDFLKRHGAPRTIDYLSIDTEGSEYEILAAFPFGRVGRPADQRRAQLHPRPRADPHASRGERLCPRGRDEVGRLLREGRRHRRAHMTKRALITGITGQDGSYLAEFLLDKGYEVHGIKRRASSFNTQRVDHLYEDPHATNRRFALHYGDLTDTSNLTRILAEVRPDEVYNLGAQSHVAVSFEAPEYTADVDGIGTLRLLEAIRFLGLEKTTRFYQASTSELYGLVQETPADRDDAVPPAQPLCGRQALRLLDLRELPRGLRDLCLQRHPVQPREPAPRRDLRDPQDHPRPRQHRDGARGLPLHGQHRQPARLGPRQGLRADAVADAAAGRARGLRDRHRPAAFGARVHRLGGRGPGDRARVQRRGHGRGRAGGRGRRATMRRWCARARW